MAAQVVSEPNRIGTFPEGFAEACHGGAPNIGQGPDPLLCELVKAYQAGYVVPGEQLSNRELNDVQRRVRRGPSEPLPVGALAAQPLLEACLHKVGNGKPTLPACEWALRNESAIIAARP